jgi:hypothetical protein
LRVPGSSAPEKHQIWARPAPRPPGVRAPAAAAGRDEPVEGIPGSAGAGGRAVERERRRASQLVDRMLQPDEHLRDGVERELREAIGERAQLGDEGGAAGGVRVRGRPAKLESAPTQVSRSQAARDADLSPRQKRDRAARRHSRDRSGRGSARGSRSADTGRAGC